VLGFPVRALGLVAGINFTFHLPHFAYTAQTVASAIASC
jgi:hypothetical protein